MATRTRSLKAGREDWLTTDEKDWQQPQRKEEGRGWAKAKATTSDNTYTGQAAANATTKPIVLRDQKLGFGR